MKVDSYLHSFFPRTISDRDTVDAEVVESGTVETFKAKLKTNQIHPNSQYAHPNRTVMPSVGYPSRGYADYCTEPEPEPG